MVERQPGDQTTGGLAGLTGVTATTSSFNSDLRFAFSSLGLAPLQLVLAASRDGNSLPEWYSFGKSWLVLGFIEIDFCR